MQSFTLLTAAIAALPIVSAGKAYVHNKCDFDIHAWSVDADGSSDAILIKSGGQYSEEYRKPSQGGVSIKLMNNADTPGPVGKISQFEYTLGDTIWYDMSNVDCGGTECPFAEQGWYLDASDASCPTRSCEGGLLTCVGAYVAFNDDWNTLMCQADKDISIYLCTSTKPSDNGDDTSSQQTQVQKQETPAPAASSAPAAAPAPAPAPSAPAAAPAPAPAPETKTSNAVYVNESGLLSIGKREHGVPSHRRRVHTRHPHARPAVM